MRVRIAVAVNEDEEVYAAYGSTGEMESEMQQKAAGYLHRHGYGVTRFEVVETEIPAPDAVEAVEGGGDG